jgi:hypothetical protein
MATATVPTNQMPCLICGSLNHTEVLLCAGCSAPTALTHEAQAQARQPRIISVVGDSNVGKTVYLGFLLDMLAQRAAQYEAIPRGPYSVDLPQLVISHMAHRMFPPKTPMESNQWNWTYYQVRRRQRRAPWADLVMPDMAGEAIAAEVAAPSTFRVIESLLGQSAGVLLLVDAALAGNGSSQPDFFALKMLSYIDAMFPRQQHKRLAMPVAIVLTKADYVPECFDDPRRFVRANLNRLWHMIESRFACVEFFASSVVGALGFATSEKEKYVTPIPLHTALRGILEPFGWILDQL